MERYEPARLADYSEGALLDEIRRVAALAPEGTLTRDRFAKHSRVTPRTIRRRFGSWEQALLRAGHGHRYGGAPATRLAAARSVRTLSDEDMLETVREVARKLGRETLGYTDVDRHGRISAAMLRRRFGNWTDVVRRAGLAPAVARYKDAELLDNIRAVWRHLGRQPMSYEMADPPSRINAHTYRYRFGSWKKAVAAFCAAEGGIAAAGGPPQPQREPLSAKLRYEVLARDRFRCQACGRSPATDLGCALHVDHIVPVSKGGATAADNLRALCAECNMGRSDRVEGDAVAEPGALKPPAADGSSVR